jgi:hypothetical protein
LPSDLVVAQESLFYAQSTTGPHSILLARAAARAAAEAERISLSDQDRLFANQLRDEAQRLLTLRLIDEAAEALANCLGADEFGRRSSAELAVNMATEALTLDEDLDPAYIDYSRTILARAMAYLGISAGQCIHCVAGG